MLDSRVRDLVKIGDRLFEARPITLWQALADNFYPERADFISTRSADTEIASGLMTSFPVQNRRDLGDTIAAMMRPRNMPWFELHTSDEEVDEDDEARRWQEYATGVVRRAMYDPLSGFVRATKESDHDWVTFGQAVILPSPNRNRDGLLYQTLHLRDCAWSVAAHGGVNCMHRKWTPTATQLCQMFPKTINEKVKKLKLKEPHKEINCRHIVVPRDEYREAAYSSSRGDYISFYVDEEHQTVLEEVGQATLRYVVPRWATISNSAYGRSPVTEIMLPDARTLQALTRIILEAGEKAVDPPMIAAEEVFRSDFDLRSGGLTWADVEADQRLQDKFAQLQLDKSGIPAGVNIAQVLQESLVGGFYLNKINLPPTEARDMTAYETRKRIEEHLRQVAPLFEPVEEDYNTPLLDETFEIMKEHKAFGPEDSVPEKLRGKDARFVFRSPLRETEDEVNASRFKEGMEIIGIAAQVDPAQLKQIRLSKAVHESLRGIKLPADWIEAEEAVEEEANRVAEEQKMIKGAAAADAMAEVGMKGGKAAVDLQKAGVV